MKQIMHNIVTDIDASIDINCKTGADVMGWDHVVQCINDFLTTRFGERIMREWYGSIVPRLLGENLTADTVVKFFQGVAAALDQWEPRFCLKTTTPMSVGRDGHLTLYLQGEYRPRALLGDLTTDRTPRKSTLKNGIVLANYAN